MWNRVLHTLFDILPNVYQHARCACHNLRMSATPPRSTPSPSAASPAEGGLLPDLYRTAVGPVNSAYYQQQFKRFEALGKAAPSWNHGAAFFTLAWLVLRRLWRPAMLYAGLLLALLLLWWGLHGLLPLAVEAGVLAVAVLLLCALPGLLGNALYYHSVRNQTLQVLGQAPTLAQARQQLHGAGSSTERFHTIAAVQAVVTAVLAGVLFHYADWSALRPALSASTLVQAGTPDLAAPSADSLPASDSATHSLDRALEQALQQVAPPAPQSAMTAAVFEAPTAAADTAPAADPEAPQTEALDGAAPQPLESAAAAAAVAVAPPPPAEAPPLSITTFAQAVPATEGEPNTSPSAAASTVTAAATAATSAAVVAATAPSSVKTPETPAAQPAKVKVNAAAAAAAAQPPVRSAKESGTGNTPNHGSLQPGKFYLNAGVYAQTANVQRATQALTRAKLNVVTQTLSSNKGSMTRLRIGPFDSRQQALQAAATAQQLHIETSVFQHPRK